MADAAASANPNYPDLLSDSNCGSHQQMAIQSLKKVAIVNRFAKVFRLH